MNHYAHVIKCAYTVDVKLVNEGIKHSDSLTSHYPFVIHTCTLGMPWLYASADCITFINVLRYYTALFHVSIVQITSY